MIRQYYLVLISLLLLSMLCSLSGLAENFSPTDVPIAQSSLNASSGQGPDYQLVFVELPVSESTAFPGGLLHPTLMIQNAGTSGQEDILVNVSGYLGNITLIPVSNSFPAIKNGEEQMVSLTYQIPENIEFGGYVLSLMVDSDLLSHDTNTSNNGGKAGGIVSVTPPDDEEFIGCEACWEGYR